MTAVNTFMTTAIIWPYEEGKPRAYRRASQNWCWTWYPFHESHWMEHRQSYCWNPRKSKNIY